MNITIQEEVKVIRKGVNLKENIKYIKKNYERI